MRCECRQDGVEKSMSDPFFVRTNLIDNMHETRSITVLRGGAYQIL